MKMLHEVLLGIGLFVAAALITWGVAGWSEDLARVTAGILLAGLCALFLVEVN